MASVDKTLFIESTELSKISGRTNIPTALCYKNNATLFGYEALSEINNNRIVNKNFKIELGDFPPEAVISEKNLIEADNGTVKSAFELTRDFFNSILENIEGQDSIPAYDRKGLKILVAEPLSFQVENRGSSWIKNYRDNIERVLHRYEKVDFLPEPFAVYQYYRYGLKIPQLAGKEKHIALIIDFGGGTFDVSIIESTNAGDISLSGKHAKPLAASSEPYGGFYINQKIGEYLIIRNLEESSDKKKADQHIKTYERVKAGNLDFDQLNNEKKSFIRNLKKIVQSVEDRKIDLCKKITNWDLSVDCYEKVLIEIPLNPFSTKSRWIETSFFGHELRTIFKNQIWDQKLKKVINSAM